MTTVINLYGGPGTGKSTSAAYLYCRLKLKNINSELVREYVKDWVWEERKIGQYDQVYFLGKQMRRESILYGKVDYMVTDSPVLLSLYYARLHSSPEMADGIHKIVGDYYKQAAEKGHKHVHVFLRRSKPYNPAGRYQNEDQAKDIDTSVKAMLTDLGISYIESDTWESALDETLEKLLVR